MKTLIRTRFEDAAELAERLVRMQRDAQLEEMGKPKEDKNPVIYVMGPDGTQFSAATLQQEVLTDGSRVYQIILEA